MPRKVLPVGVLTVGDKIRTLPTVKPAKYANKSGEITSFSENEFLVVSRWFKAGAWFKSAELSKI